MSLRSLREDTPLQSPKEILKDMLKLCSIHYLLSCPLIKISKVVDFSTVHLSARCYYRTKAYFTQHNQSPLALEEQCKYLFTDLLHLISSKADFEKIRDE